MDDPFNSKTGQLTWRMPGEDAPRSFAALPLFPSGSLDPEKDARPFIVADLLHGGPVQAVTVPPASSTPATQATTTPLSTATTADLNAMIADAVANALAQHTVATQQAPAPSTHLGSPSPEPAPAPTMTDVETRGHDAPTAPESAPATGAATIAPRPAPA